MIIVGIKTLEGKRFYKMTRDEYDTFFVNYRAVGGDYFYMKRV